LPTSVPLPSESSSRRSLSTSSGSGIDGTSAPTSDGPLTLTKSGGRGASRSLEPVLDVTGSGGIGASGTVCFVGLVKSGGRGASSACFCSEDLGALVKSGGKGASSGLLLVTANGLAFTPSDFFNDCKKPGGSALGVEEAAKGLGVVDLVVSGGRGASSLLFGVPKMLELFVSADFPKMLE
jgi:hypothetical protein